MDQIHIDRINLFIDRKKIPFKEHKEDIKQEMYLLGLEKLKRREARKDSRGSFSYKHLYIDALRKLRYVARKKRGNPEEKEMSKDIMSFSNRENRHYFDANNSMENIAAEVSEDSQVWSTDLREILKVMPKTNLILMNLIILGFTHKEIANFLGVSDANISLKLKRIISNPDKEVFFNLKEENRDMMKMKRENKNLKIQYQRTKDELNRTKRINQGLEMEKEAIQEKYGLISKRGERHRLALPGNKELGESVEIKGDTITIKTKIRGKSNLLKRITTLLANNLRASYTMEVTAKILGVSNRTVSNYTRKARAVKITKERLDGIATG